MHLNFLSMLSWIFDKFEVVTFVAKKSRSSLRLCAGTKWCWMEPFGSTTPAWTNQSRC